MLSNRLAFAALGAACIAAAAGGGYLASRQNAVPTPVAAISTPESTPAPALTPERPVEETEAVVSDSALKTPTPTPISSEPPAAPPAMSPSRRPAAAPRVADGAPRRPVRDSQPPASTARQEPPATPTLSSSWPSSASAQPPAPNPPAAPTENTLPAGRPAEAVAPPEPVRAPEPPQPTFEELVVAADSVIGLQTENRITSETARVEDRVEARVTRDVKVGDRVAIPAGARAIGTVTQVERGGKFRERARLGVRFHSLVLADGTRIPISTETIYRDAPANSSAAKIGGGAVGGAILGAILGGAKGAAIGATAGAGGGAAVVAAGDRSAVVLAPGTPMTIRILSPVTVTTQRE